jgi:hypothetical protein
LFAEELEQRAVIGSDAGGMKELLLADYVFVCKGRVASHDHANDHETDTDSGRHEPCPCEGDGTALTRRDRASFHLSSALKRRETI